MKKHLRLFSFLLAGIIACFTICALPVFAAGGSIQVYAPSTPVNVGDSVTVTVTLRCSDGLGSWDFKVYYDSSRLQYVSGADNGGGGTTAFSDAAVGEGQTSKTYSVRFRAIAEGSASVRSGAIEFINWNFEELSVSSDSCTINVQNSSGNAGGDTPAPAPAGPASTENRLSALSVAGYEISPAFESSEGSYSVQVPYAQKSVEVSATPTDASARVNIAGADALAVGDNTITVTVTAASGDQRTYTIALTRADAAYDALSLAVDDRPYEFPRDASEVSSIPEGFTEDRAVCREKEVLTFVNESRSIRLAVLFSAAQEAGGPEESVFLYDEKSESFSPYIPTQTAPRTFVILPLPEGQTVPEGYENAALFLAETEMSAWKAKDGDANLYLVWASPVDGEADFYFYDPDTGEFTLAFPKVPAQTADAEELAKLEAEIETLKKKNEDLWHMTRYTILIAVGLIILIVLSMIVTRLVRRAQRRKETAKADDTPSEQATFGMPFEAVAPQEETAPPEEESYSYEEEPTEDAGTQEEESAPVFEETAPAPEAKPEPEVAPEEPTKPKPAEPERQVVRPENETRSAVEQIFGTAPAAVSEEELFRKNNPTLDDGDDEIDEDGDRPLYDFHHGDE